MNGLPSKVGFKALGANGKGKEVEGEIIDEDNQVITTFKSNSLGMGHFIIDKVDASTQYSARLTSKNINSTIPVSYTHLTLPTILLV